MKTAKVSSFLLLFFFFFGGGGGGRGFRLASFGQSGLISDLHINFQTSRNGRIYYLVTLKAITKTCLYNFDLLGPLFYIVRLGFTGVYIIFLICAQKHRLWYSFKPPLWGGSNEHPNLCFEQKNEKSQSFFYLKIFNFFFLFTYLFIFFLAVKFSTYLNRRVFVMAKQICSRRHSKTDILLFFRESKTWHFMWIVCQILFSLKNINLW